MQVVISSLPSHQMFTPYVYINVTQYINIWILYQFSHQSQVEKCKAYRACRSKELKEQHGV